MKNIKNKFWLRAKKNIAGGNSMISKHPDMFLPNQWPTYFKKTRGCKVWDLDGKKYFDLSIMGAGKIIVVTTIATVD